MNPFRYERAPDAQSAVATLAARARAARSSAAAPTSST